MTIQNLSGRFADLSHCRFGLMDFNYTLVGWPDGSMLHVEALARATSESQNPDEWLEHFRHMFDRYNEPFELGAFSPVSRMRGILRDLGIEPEDQLVARLIAIEEDAVVAPTYVYNGVELMLLHLRAQGFTLGLCCNGNPYTEAVYRRQALAPWFDAAAFSFRIGHKKPHIEMYRAIMAETVANAARCFYAGDGGDNEFGGMRKCYSRTATVRCRWCREKVAKRDQEVDPSAVDFTVDTPEELLQLVAPVTVT